MYVNLWGLCSQNYISNGYGLKILVGQYGLCSQYYMLDAYMENILPDYVFSVSFVCLFVLVIYFKKILKNKKILTAWR